MHVTSFLLRCLPARSKGRLTRRLLSELSARERARAVEFLLETPVEVDTPNGPVRFLNHGRGSHKRAETLLTKEPDSLKWIDEMAPGSIFWDIGANVGALTLYAALRGDLEVWAFEPAAVNHYILAANCELNRLDGQVRCLQLGFGNRNDLRDLHVSQMKDARSFTFRQKRQARATAEAKHYPARQLVQTWTIDDFIAQYRLACPNYIKIDVPGLTPEILLGAQRTLAQGALRELQIEAKEDSVGGRRILSLLTPLGFEVTRRNSRLDGRPSGDLVFSRVREPVARRLPAAAV